jgi:hypothetical protein
MDSMDDVMRLVEEVAADPDHKARGINMVATTWEALLRLRDEVNDLIRDSVLQLSADHPWKHVKAWRWRVASTGPALTDAGRQHGLELHLAWHQVAQF